MFRYIRYSLLLGLLFSSLVTFGADLRLDTTVRVTSVSGGIASLQINFSWKHSWSDPYNSDAVWIFLKWRTSRGEWSPVYPNTTASTPDGYASFPGVSGTKTVGFFVYHSQGGLFPTSNTSLTVTWPLPAAVTKQMLDNNEVDIVAYGVEMLLVPFGSFLAGDGVSDQSFTTPGSAAALSITSERALSISALGDSPLAASSGSSPSDPSPALSAGLNGSGPRPEIISLNGSFPKGFNGFYCMKYELSQGQYTDFLNSLSLGDQIRLLGERVTSLPRGSFLFGDATSASFRNTIQIIEPASASRGIVFTSGGSPSAAVDGESLHTSGSSPVACNYLSPCDLLAYASWSGLRPMSELEFEKTCRRSAPLSALAGGFAWDSDTYTPLSGLLDIDTDSERPVSGNVNGGASGESPGTNSPVHSPLSSSSAGGLYTSGGSPVGPVRCGAFSSSGSDRFSSGASFSGTMELSGNVREMCVRVDASSFTRTLHGDGTYPLLPFGDNIKYTHIGTRGGSFLSPSDRLRVSDRKDMANTFSSSDTRLSDVGFRLVRSIDPSFISVTPGFIGKDSTYCSGEPFTLTSLTPASVSGIGGIDLRYEWYMDGGRVTGASGASLSFPSGLFNVPSSGDKHYRFTRRVVTALGSSESNTVTILVRGRLSLDIRPDSLVVSSSASASFEASSLTAGQISWFLNDTKHPIEKLLSGPSAISSGSPVLYTPVYGDFDNLPGSYRLLVRGTTSGGCTETSLLTATVRFNILGGLITGSDTICQGDPFIVNSKKDASFSGLPGLLPSYSWYMNGLLLTDLNSHGPSLSVPSTLAGGKPYLFFRRAFSSDNTFADSDTVEIYVKRCTPLRTDGKPYKTVMIGDAEWFSENLELPSSSGESWPNGLYGRLYNWDAALSACPSGWHLPSDEDWDIWSETYSGVGLGTKMKATNAGWSNADNTSGFSALAGKGCTSTGTVDTSISGLYASFWTSTQTGSNPRIRRLLDSSSALSSTTRGSGYGQSVRCVRD